jgi:Trp operon repressor
MKEIILPAVNRYPSRKDWEEACWQKILKSGDLLELLVTPYERRILVIRAAVIDRLSLGKSYRQIAEELWLSSQTISGIKKAIKENSYRSYRQRGKVERKRIKYSPFLRAVRVRPDGRPVRTKYGTIYLP